MSLTKITLEIQKQLENFQEKVNSTDKQIMYDILENKYHKFVIAKRKNEKLVKYTDYVRTYNVIKNIFYRGIE